MKLTILIFLCFVTLFPLETLKDNPILNSLAGRWILLESNYYMGDKLTNYKGHLNIIYTITIEGNAMIWRSNKGLVKTFYFDYETQNKTVKVADYEDKISSKIEGETLIHEVDRKYLGKPKILKVRNTFELKDGGKTMHHIYEDLNGNEVYKMHAIYSRDVKSIVPQSLSQPDAKKTPEPKEKKK